MHASPGTFGGMSVDRKIKFVRSVGGTHDYLFKVIMVGDSGTGKSALCHRFSHDAYNPSYIATIGVDFQVASFTLPDGKVAKQQVRGANRRVSQQRSRPRLRAAVGHGRPGALPQHHPGLLPQHGRDHHRLRLHRPPLRAQRVRHLDPGGQSVRAPPARRRRRRR